MKIRITRCRGGRYEAAIVERPDIAPAVESTKHEAVGVLLVRAFDNATGMGAGGSRLLFEEDEAVFPAVTWSGTPPHAIKDGTCFTATLLGDTTRAALDRCVDEVIVWPDGERAPIASIETFALITLRARMPIGVVRRARMGLRAAIQACFDRGEDPITGGPLD